VQPLGRPNADLAELLDEYIASRYVNAATGRQARGRLDDLFRVTGVRWPAELSEAMVVQWCGNPRANNTVRQRISIIRTFLSWCERHGLQVQSIDLDPLRSQHPKLYGKVQDVYPGRWLSYDEAFGPLLEACRTGTWVGSRDQLVIRLGLMGLRAGEIVGLTLGALTPDQQIQWVGKGRRGRSVSPGPTFLGLLARWCRAYEQALGRPVRSTDPLLCRAQRGGTVGADRPVLWGQPLGKQTLGSLVTLRAQLAGLGHVAPHDLRRTAAGILHRTVTTDGGHVYDLLDIQQVMDHADPATTLRSYLEPISRKTKQAAGLTLD
jgi:integrase